MNEDAFFLRVAHALTGCQLVEEELKLYITHALDLARKCVGTTMPFNMNGGDYEGLPLGKLIRVFGKLTANATLVSELHSFSQERNFLSHRAIAHCLDYDGELDYSTAPDVQRRMGQIQAEAQRLREAIHAEGGHISAQLDFWDAPERSKSQNSER